jgi:integrase/recombinase XerD
MLSAARESDNPFDFALVCLLGLLGLRIFETAGANIDDLGEEHGHRVLRVGGKVVLVPLPSAVSRAVDRAAGERTTGPLLLNRRGWTGLPPPAGFVTLRPLPASAYRG